MATVGVVLRKVFTVGDRKCVVADVTLTGSYITDGEALTGANLGLEYLLDQVVPGPAVITGGILEARYSHATAKLLLYGAVDGTPAANEALPQIAAAAIPGGPAVVRMVALGKGTAAA